MVKVNVSSNKRQGRLTQIMNENFSDVARAVNEKLICSKIAKNKLEKVEQIIQCLEEAEHLSKEISGSRRYKDLVNELKALRLDFSSYLSSIR